MNVKIAIATTDGKVINEHFGRAKMFYIFEVDEKQAKFLESRSVERCCENGEHQEDAFYKVAETLKDCKAIFVAKIGYGAVTYMESKGFKIFEAPFFIPDVLDRIIQDNILEV